MKKIILLRWILLLWSTLLDSLVVEGLDNHLRNYAGRRLLAKEPDRSARLLEVDELIAVHAHIDIVPEVGIHAAEVEVGNSHFGALQFFPNEGLFPQGSPEPGIDLQGSFRACPVPGTSCQGRKYEKND